VSENSSNTTLTKEGEEGNISFYFKE